MSGSQWRENYKDETPRLERTPAKLTEFLVNYELTRILAEGRPRSSDISWRLL